MRSTTEILGLMMRGEEVAVEYNQVTAIREAWKVAGEGPLKHYYCKDTGCTMVYADNWQTFLKTYGALIAKAAENTC